MVAAVTSSLLLAPQLGVTCLVLAGWWRDKPAHWRGALQVLTAGCPALPAIPALLAAGALSLFQLAVIAGILRTAVDLATGGGPQFQVVDSCSGETCENPDTGTTFQLEDACEPREFAACTACPRARCVFHHYRTGRAEWIILTIINVFHGLWLLLFLHYFLAACVRSSLTLRYCSLHCSTRNM